MDADVQKDLGILTKEVRARPTAQAVASGASSDTAGPASKPGNGGSTIKATAPGTTKAAAEAMTDTPPVLPAKMIGLDLGPACSQCGGMMQRTRSCYTCSSCGSNTGCR